MGQPRNCLMHLPLQCALHDRMGTENGGLGCSTHCMHAMIGWSFVWCCCMRPFSCHSQYCLVSKHPVVHTVHRHNQLTSLRPVLCSLVIVLQRAAAPGFAALLLSLPLCSALPLLSSPPSILRLLLSRRIHNQPDTHDASTIATFLLLRPPSFAPTIATASSALHSVSYQSGMNTGLIV